LAKNLMIHRFLLFSNFWVRRKVRQFFSENLRALSQDCKWIQNDFLSVGELHERSYVNFCKVNESWANFHCKLCCYSSRIEFLHWPTRGKARNYCSTHRSTRMGW
jgi:hypothetical protein